MPYSSKSSHETPVERLRQELDRVLDTFWTQGERAIDAIGLRPGGKHWVPDVDMIETCESVVVLCDLPGVDPQSVEILLTGNMLTVKGDRMLSPILHDGDVRHRQESPNGVFNRSVPLPASVDPDKVSAEARNGVLTITVAKRESAKVRQIKVDVKRAETPPTASM